MARAHALWLKLLKFLIDWLHSYIFSLRCETLGTIHQLSIYEGICIMTAPLGLVISWPATFHLDHAACNKDTPLRLSFVLVYNNTYGFSVPGSETITIVSYDADSCPFGGLAHARYSGDSIIYVTISYFMSCHILKTEFY